ncbi:hypothetical protein [Chitinimonas naiadis]
MALPLKTRIHEWLADRISWVQYPGIQVVPARQRQPSTRGLRFAHSMSPWARIELLTISLFALVVGLVVLTVLGAIAYAVLSAAFS